MTNYLKKFKLFRYLVQLFLLKISIEFFSTIIEKNSEIVIILSNKTTHFQYNVINYNAPIEHDYI